MSGVMDSNTLHGHVCALRRVETWLQLARRLAAASCGISMAGIACLLFLAGHSTAGQSTILVLCLAALAVFLPCAPVAILLKRRLWRRRNRMHGLFYAAGLRVEAGWRVVTNEPHARLVYDGETAPFHLTGHAVAAEA